MRDHGVRCVELVACSRCSRVDFAAQNEISSFDGRAGDEIVSFITLVKIQKQIRISYLRNGEEEGGSGEGNYSNGRIT